MKKPLLALSVLTLSLSSIITPIQATAALLLSVGNEQLPTAPMLGTSDPAVVSIAVEGKQVQRQQIPEQFQFFGPEQTRERPFRGLGSGVIIDAKKAISSPTITL